MQKFDFNQIVGVWFKVIYIILYLFLYYSILKYIVDEVYVFSEDKYLIVFVFNYCLMLLFKMVMVWSYILVVDSKQWLNCKMFFY